MAWEVVLAHRVEVAALRAQLERQQVDIEARVERLEAMNERLEDFQDFTNDEHAHALRELEDGRDSNRRLEHRIELMFDGYEDLFDSLSLSFNRASMEREDLLSMMRRGS